MSAAATLPTKQPNGSEQARAGRKRSCITTACRPCRKRKTKCDGTRPVCFTCKSYGTECVYNNTDGRRRHTTAYVDALKTRLDSLESLLIRLKTSGQEEASALLSQLREGVYADNYVGLLKDGYPSTEPASGGPLDNVTASEGPPATDAALQGRQAAFEDFNQPSTGSATLTDELTQVMSQLDIDEGGEVRYVGPSSNLNLASVEPKMRAPSWDRDIGARTESVSSNRSTILSALDIDLDGAVFSTGDQLLDNDPLNLQGLSGPGTEASQALEEHLLALYWTWQHPFFTLFSRSIFLRDREIARASGSTGTRSKHFSPLLLNAILAHAAHLSSRPEVRTDPNDPATAGSRYFRIARRLLEAECESPSMTTVQALALMGSREAGCGRDVGLGWLYSGMSFRMALDLGLHLRCDDLVSKGWISQEEADARVITFWGCYLFDKGWSAYLGRPESMPAHLVERTPRPAVKSEEEFAFWMAYGDEPMPMEPKVAYTISTSRQIVAVAEILGSVIRNLYPASSNGLCSNYADVVVQHHSSLLSWLQELPSHLRVRKHDYSISHLLPQVLVMHMLYHTTMILVFRPMISQNRSKLLPEPFDPLGLCTSSAVKIATLTKAYQTRYSLRKIVNIAVHCVFTASTIHLSNLTSTNVGYESSARHYLSHCMSFLQEIGETWPSATRSLHVIRGLITKYRIPGDFSTYETTTTNELRENEETSPKDYTFDARLEHKAAASLPTMPQLRPQTSQVDHRTSNTVMQTLPLEAPIPPSQADFSSDLAEQYCIPTDFEMAVFDVPDMSMAMFATDGSWNFTQ